MASNRSRPIIALAALAFVLTLAGCGSDDGIDPNESASTRAIREKVRAEMEIERLQRYGPRLANVNAALAESPTAVTLAAAAPSEEASESAGESVSGLARGEAIYTRNCASCHGARGEGDGPVAASLIPQPAKHSDGVYMNALSDDHLYKVIAQGGAAVGKSTMMAPWGTTLDDDEIKDVIEFLRTLADPPYPGPAAATAG